MSSASLKFSSVIGKLNLDNTHINQAFEYYHQRYLLSEKARSFVVTSPHINTTFKSCQNIGYVDRTLGKNICKTRTVEGAAIRGCLQRYGLIHATGHELFRGCIVFPTANEDGNVVSAVGHRIGRLRKGDKSPVYWNKPMPKAFVERGMTMAKELIHGKAHH